MSGALSKITVLTRFHSIDKLYDLDHMLFSLAGQNDVAVESIILGQQIASQYSSDIERLCEKYRSIGLRVTFINFDFDAPGDHRAELLNNGLRYVKTRYLAFLDCDDVVYPSCYSRLISRLTSSQCPLAFTGVMRADRFQASGSQYCRTKFPIFKGMPKTNFFLANQYPIHSYIIDLDSVDRDMLCFDRGVTRNEDYAFLYRLLSRYRFDDEECGRVNCEYRVDIEGSNTILAYRSDRASVDAWTIAEEYMDSIRANHRITLDFRDLSTLCHYYRALGLQDARTAAAVPAAPVVESDQAQDRDRQTLRDALAMALEKMIAHTNARELSVCVEQVERLGGGLIQISGWMALDAKAPLVALFSCEADSNHKLVTEFEHRLDVAQHFNSKDVNFGFSVKMPISDQIGIVALSDKGSGYFKTVAVNAENVSSN